MVFMFPETRYSRPEHPPISTLHTHTRAPSGDSTTETESKPPLFTKGITDTVSKEPSPETKRASSDHVTEAPPHQHMRGRPSKAQFSLIPRLQLPASEIKRTLLVDILAPLQIVTYPIILWVFLAFCFTTNCLLALNLTQSQVFAAPPYNFSPAAVGFVNFAFVVGGIIGLCTAGPASDWLSLKLARRNGGVREAEMRLWILIPYIAICLVGMTVCSPKCYTAGKDANGKQVTAVGYQRHWAWQIIVVIGYGFVGIEVVSIPAILISVLPPPPLLLFQLTKKLQYAVDCYKHIPGQIMITATVAKNTFGFGLIFYYNDWAVRAGFIPPVMTIMALAVGFTTIGMVVFLVAGKSFRRRTAGSKVHSL